MVTINLPDSEEDRKRLDLLQESYLNNLIYGLFQDYDNGRSYVLLGALLQYPDGVCPHVYSEINRGLTKGNYVPYGVRRLTAVSLNRVGVHVPQDAEEKYCNECQKFTAQHFLKAPYLSKWAIAKMDQFRSDYWNSLPAKIPGADFLETMMSSTQIKYEGRRRTVSSFLTAGKGAESNGLLDVIAYL